MDWIKTLETELSHRFRRVAPFSRKPRVANRIEPGIVGIQIDETALNQEVSNFEYIAPASGMCHAGTPGSIRMLSRAGSLDGERVAAGHDPIEGGVIMKDMLDQTAEVAEQPSDLALAGGEAPLGKEDLSIL